MRQIGEFIFDCVEYLVPNKVYSMKVQGQENLSALKVKIVNNRDKDEYFGSLFKDGVFPASAYKHLVDTIYAYHKVGCKITIIVNPDVIEGNI